MEKTTHVHPITPLVIWGPLAVWLTYRSVFNLGLSGLTVAGFAFAGILFWTLSEYLLHRFVFHWVVTGPLSERFQYIIHGLHHADPIDKTRLVMPPVPALILAGLLYGMFRVLLGPVYVEPFFAFFLMGYLWYDYTHYYVHHFNPTTSFGKMIKQHHMMHHFVAHGARWGVSTPLWDFLLGTLEQPKETDESAKTA